MSELTKTFRDMGFDITPCSSRGCNGGYIFNVHDPAYRRGFLCVCQRYFCKDCSLEEFGKRYQHKYCLMCRCSESIDDEETEETPRSRKISSLRRPEKIPKISKHERKLSIKLPPTKKQVINKLRHTYT